MKASEAREILHDFLLMDGRTRTKRDNKQLKITSSNNRENVVKNHDRHVLKYLQIKTLTHKNLEK